MLPFSFAIVKYTLIQPGRDGFSTERLLSLVFFHKAGMVSLDMLSRGRRMDEKISRRDLVKSLAALYLAALGIPLLSGCSKEQTAAKIEGQVPPVRDKVTAVPEKEEVTDLVVVTGDSPGQNTQTAIDAMGGIKKFVREGDKVVVKPNILHAAEPQYAVTTNPEVIGMIVAQCVSAGASDVLVIDRPTRGADMAYEVTGIGPATKKAGGRVKILADRDFTEVAIPKGLILKSWPVARDVLNADALINVPIAKQHGVTGLTLGMKNLMGIIGGNRGLIHQDIHQKLADLSTLIIPSLTVLDATRILVRNGPSGGSLDDVVKRDTVVAGIDPVLVDAFGTTLFDMQPADIGYIVRAAEMGLGSDDVFGSYIKRMIS